MTPDRPVSPARLVALVSRYGLVGLLCAVINVAIIAVGTQTLGLPYPVAAGGTCLITIPLSYLLHRWISFKVPGPASWREFGRFLTAQLSQFALGFVLMAAIIEGLGWRPWIAMAFASLILAAFGFVASSAWVFGVWQRHAAIAPDATAARPIRALHVSAFFPAHGGGIEVVAGQLAMRLARAGLRVHWMAGGSVEELPSEATPGLVIDRAASIDFLERSVGLPAPVWGPLSLRRLWQGVGASDIVHVHDYLYVSSLAAVLFAWFRRRPVVLTQHIGDIAFDARLPRLALSLLNDTLGRWVLGRVDQVVFVGKPVLNYFGSFVHYRRPPLLIPNGVDHAIYGPRVDAACETSVQNAQGPLKALFVGRFVEKKGLAYLRHCMSLPDVHWTFIGRGPASPDEWNIPASRLQLPGVLSAARVADAMRAADLLVLPSKGEGFPLVIQEALSCGTPVLVSREIADAFPQIDSRCVWSVDLTSSATEDAVDVAGRFSAEVARLACAPASLRAARPLAVALAAQWSWETCVDDYLHVYRAIRR